MAICWRKERSAEGYEFSFRAARLPDPRAAARYAGLAVELLLQPRVAASPAL